MPFHRKPLIQEGISELIGFDKHFVPTCARENSYRYDSYDAKYETLKYTRPKECVDCAHRHKKIFVKKSIKLKSQQILEDTQRLPVVQKLGRLYSSNEPPSNESMRNLKNIFSSTMFGIGAKVHFDLVTLVYNASKLACDRIMQMLSQQAS